MHCIFGIVFNVVEIDAWVICLASNTRTSHPTRVLTEKQTQAPRLYLLELLRRVDPVNKTKLGLTVWTLS